MNTQYAIDLALRPTTFDLWHICLAGTVAVLAVLLISLLLIMVFSLTRRKPELVVPVAAAPMQPEIKVVEKIVEVEKIVRAPAPEPIILKEATPDAALQLLALLQKEARFLDFIKEDVAAFGDADVGIAARVVHAGCLKAINEYFSLTPVRTEAEGSKITLVKEFDAAQVRLIGNIVGQPPFIGTLIHKGWQVTDIRLPKLTQGHNAKIVAAAEVEL